MTRRTYRWWGPGIVAVVGAVLLAGCSASTTGSNSASGSGDQSGTRGSVLTGTGVGGLVGWDCPLGRCDWSGASPAGDDSIRDATPVTGAPVSTAAPVSTSTALGVTTSSVLGVPPTTSSATTTPGATGPEYSTDSSARGGSLPKVSGTVDDNQQWTSYLDYRRAFDTLGINTEKISVDGRQVITVVDAAHHPVIGADVNVADGTGRFVAHLATHADGTVVFLPPAGAPAAYHAVVSREGATASVSLPSGPGAVTVTLGPVALPAHAKVDVLFLVDATASMADELDRLKANIDSIEANLRASYATPDIRFAMTVYRDADPHELFDTRTYGFTADGAQFSAALHEVQAGGGGDTREDVNGALHDALTKPGWRGDDTEKLLFLVSDAPPHLDLNEVSYRQNVSDANQLGVQVMAVAATGVDLEAVFLYRQLAMATGGRFVFLTGGTDGSTPTRTPEPVTPDATSSKALDEVITSLIGDELAAMVR